MKTKTLLATLALTLAPTFALAEGCGFGHAKSDTASMSCVNGSVYDADAQRCVPTTG